MKQKHAISEIVFRLDVLFDFDASHVSNEKSPHLKVIGVYFSNIKYQMENNNYIIHFNPTSLLA